jgi:hypothetical protein
LSLDANTDSGPKAKFEPVRLRVEPHWYVRVTFPSGQQKYIGGFETEAAAQEWIALKSAEWLQLKSCEQKLNR